MSRCVWLCLVALLASACAMDAQSAPEGAEGPVVEETPPYDEEAAEEPLPASLDQETLEDEDREAVELARTESALLRPCGSYAYPGDSVRCGTVWIGESKIVVRNPNGCESNVYIDHPAVRGTYRLYPWENLVLTRWYGGRDVIVTNLVGSCGPVVVSH